MGRITHLRWVIVILAILQIVDIGFAKKNRRKVYWPKEENFEAPDYTHDSDIPPPVIPAQNQAVQKDLGKGILLLTRTFLLLSNEMRAVTTNLQELMPPPQIAAVTTNEDDLPFEGEEDTVPKAPEPALEITEAPVPQATEAPTTEETTVPPVETTVAPVVTKYSPKSGANQIFEESQKLIGNSHNIFGKPLAHIAMVLKQIPTLVNSISRHTKRLAARRSRGR